MSLLNEPQLIAGIAQGDESAFKTLFYAYKDKLYGYSLRYLKSREEAEEIVQNTFMKIWVNRTSLEPQSCFGAYVFRIAKNDILNKLKRSAFEAAFRLQVSRQSDGSHTLTESAVLCSDYENFTQRVLACLPPQQQLIFRLSRFDGLSYEEIAQTLGISPNTVKVQISRALKTLRWYFERHADLTIWVWCVMNFPG